MIFNASEENYIRMSEFTRLKRRELIAEGYQVDNIFDLPNADRNGNALCGVDRVVIGFEIAKDGQHFNRFFGDKTLLFWDELELTYELQLGDDEEDYCKPIPVASEVIEGEMVHVDSSKYPSHYKAILDVAKDLKLDGTISYDDLKSAARRYILSVQTRCNEKNLNFPRMSTALLMR